jgi:hypothetical protein
MKAGKPSAGTGGCPDLSGEPLAGAGERPDLPGESSVGTGGPFAGAGEGQNEPGESLAGAGEPSAGPGGSTNYLFKPLAGTGEPPAGLFGRLAGDFKAVAYLLRVVPGEKPATGLVRLLFFEGLLEKIVAWGEGTPGEVTAGRTDRDAGRCDAGGYEGNGTVWPPRRRPAVVGLRNVGAHRLGRLYGTLEVWPEKEVTEMLGDSAPGMAIFGYRDTVP